MKSFKQYKRGDILGGCEFLSYEGVKIYNYSNRSYTKKIGKFKCHCGMEFTTLVNHLTSGNTSSCGCMNKEKVKQVNTKHGLHKHPLYGIWQNIKNRCLNPNTAGYEYYGGRGITICDEWKNSFVPFYNWAISNNWRRGLSIDRKDTNGNYCPKNCRLATDKEQARNRKSNYLVEFEGEKICIAELCDRLALNYHTVRNRIRKYGWSVDKAISTETRSDKYNRLNIDG